MYKKILNNICNGFRLSANVNNLYSGPAKVKRTSGVIKPYYWQSEYNDTKELTRHLLANILYKDDHIIAFNKPNGLSMFSQTYEKSSNTSLQTKDFLSFNSCKEELMKELRVSDLHGVFLLNRSYSGVMVFCFNKELAEKLSHYFKNARTSKKAICAYKTICIGRHSRDSDETTLRIVEILVNGRLISAENDSYRTNRTTKISTSLIKYNTLHKSQVFFDYASAHLEVLPSSTKWDALELHAVRRFTPILGDHKYSSRIKTILDRLVLVKYNEALPEPQDLPQEICDMLGVDMGCTGDIPEHVHCSRVILPKVFMKRSGPNFSKQCLQNSLYAEDDPTRKSQDVLSKTNVIIDAPLPPFFVETMKRLRLTEDLESTLS